MMKIIEKNEVSLEKISDILNNIYIDNKFNKEFDNIIISIDSKKIMINLSKEQQLISLTLLSSIEFKNEDQFTKIALAANNINSEKIFIRSSVERFQSSIIITFDYQFRYSYGLNVPQFVDNLRFFISLLDMYIPILIPYLKD